MTLYIYFVEYLNGIINDASLKIYQYYQVYSESIKIKRNYADLLDMII